MAQMKKSQTQKLADVMTKDVKAVSRSASLRDVACVMKERQIGDVVVTDDDGKLYGIVTDRDLVVRGAAEGLDLDRTVVGEICSQQDVVTLTPDASVDEAVQLMRERAIRRIPVVKDGAPVGIVSIGDLAQLRDPASALGQISSAPPTP